MNSCNQTMLRPSAFTPQQPLYAPHGSNAGQPQQQPWQQPHLVYFITRTNGSVVPLVPVDELPYTVRLEGAPRNMLLEQTFGMQFLGTFPYTGLLFKTKDDSTPTQRSPSQMSLSGRQRQYSNGNQHVAAAGLARQATANAAQYYYNPSPEKCSQSTSATVSPPSASMSPSNDTASLTSKSPSNDPQGIIDAILASKSGAKTAARIGFHPPVHSGVFSATSATPPSGKMPDSKKKTHCSYWIRTGECDYAQQGCMYKHEMPDERGLRELGFRVTPRWWVEKNSMIRMGKGKEENEKTGRGRELVGERVSPRLWLRRGSELSESTASGVRNGKMREGRSDDETEEEGEGSENGEKLLKEERIEEEESQQQVDTKNSRDDEGRSNVQESRSVHNNPEQLSRVFAKAETDNHSASGRKELTDWYIGDLIDFGSSISPFEPASISITPETSGGSWSSYNAAAPSASTASSMQSNRHGNNKAKTLFVPKGESWSEHLADHTLRQQRRTSPSIAPRSEHITENDEKSKVQQSEAQIARLERQIHMAGKNKHTVAASVSSPAGSGRINGLMESQHAPPGSYSRTAREGRGKKKNAAELGLRIRRPAALRCVENPTNQNRKAKAEAAEKLQERKKKNEKVNGTESSQGKSVRE